MPQHIRHIRIEQECLSRIFFKMEVKLLTEEKDLTNYIENYKAIGLADVPFGYLNNNLVYGFYKNDCLMAGFVIGISAPFRTLELFADPRKHHKLMGFLNDGNAICEVCCFWQNSKFITAFDNLIIWFNMSQKIRVRGKKFFLGGTYEYGLANLYGYPTYAHLICDGNVREKSAWIFIAWRKYSVLSAIQVMIYKALKSLRKIQGRKMPNSIAFNEQALKKVVEELGSELLSIAALVDRNEY